jgi:hypothetical protein
MLGKRMVGVQPPQRFMVRVWREMTVGLAISARREESQGEQDARDRLEHLQCQFIVSVVTASVQCQC